MGNPQIEDGFTRIANELLEALCGVRIPGECRQIFDFIIRKTYGFNKKEDCIPLSQFVKATGKKKSNVIRSINTLIEMNLIAKRYNKRATRYSINKDYSTWNLLSKGITKELIEKQSNDCSIKEDNEIINFDKDIIENDKISLSEMIPSKDSTKETILKNNISKDMDDLSLNLARTIFEPLQNNNILNGLVERFGFSVINRAAKRKSDYHEGDPDSTPKNINQLLASLEKACKITSRGKSDVPQPKS